MLCTDKPPQNKTTTNALEACNSIVKQFQTLKPVSVYSSTPTLILEAHLMGLVQDPKFSTDSELQEVTDKIFDAYAEYQVYRLDTLLRAKPLIETLSEIAMFKDELKKRPNTTVREKLNKLYVKAWGTPGKPPHLSLPNKKAHGPS